MLKIHLLTAAATVALLSAPALAQDINSTSGSNANSTSGSQSGAASNQTQGQAQNANNAGIGNSDSRSASGANATSSTASTANSNGNDQGQMQGQSANNAQSQDARNSQSQGANNSQSQGQTANNGQTQTQGQTASNMQGTMVSNTFNSTPLKRQYIGTNTAVPLAASSSFSSDYCGGTASGGASVAPIGVSIGASAPVFDNSCRYLRLAEKAGMLGANLHNAGYTELSGRAFMLEAWATCMAGPQQDRKRKGTFDNHVMEACTALGLLGGEGASPPVLPPPPAPPVTEQQSVSPLYTQKPNVEPLPNDATPYLAPKTPRGDNDKTTTAVPTKPAVTTADVGNTTAMMAH